MPCLPLCCEVIYGNKVELSKNYSTETKPNLNHKLDSLGITSALVRRKAEASINKFY